MSAEMPEPWQIPSDSKVAVLAIHTSSLPPSRAAEISLEEGLRVVFTPPPLMSPRWREWLGSIRADQFERSNLVAIAWERSETPGVVDGQTNRLELKVKRFFDGILLQGTPFGFRGGMLLSAERLVDEFEVRRATNVDPVLAVAGAKPVRLLDAVFREAAQISSILGDRVWTTAAFGRLKRGFGSWRSAVREIFPEERLYGFVRSIDGVMILPPGRGRLLFSQRGQILVGRGSANDLLLDELYRLRNTSAHLKDFEGDLSAYPTAGRNVVALMRAFQAELLATEVYRRILSSQELLEHMRDDESIERLWDLEESEIQRLWRAPIDLETPCRERFVDLNTGQFPEQRLIERGCNGPARNGTGIKAEDE
jgi:hypothetical protein